jgi:uncharacterized protein (TIGR02646 family)
VKRVLKGNEPLTLNVYRQAAPLSTWDEMKCNPNYGGQQAYRDCRSDILSQQNGLCAYCEIDIRDNNPLKCHIEHFHPKADVGSGHNWALDWNNMLGVCSGGSYQYINGASFYLAPMDRNLSCDAHKDKMIQSNRLSAQCDGWILNPLQLASFPTLFSIEKSTGRLMADTINCANSTPLTNNKHTSIEGMVQNTIDMLNLNCERLSQARLMLIRDIESNKKKQRQAGLSAQQGLENLAQRYFHIQWKEYFTTIRLCLGQTAETHLQSINFQG